MRKILMLKVMRYFLIFPPDLALHLTSYSRLFILPLGDDRRPTTGDIFNTGKRKRFCFCGVHMGISPRHVSEIFHLVNFIQRNNKTAKKHIHVSFVFKNSVSSSKFSSVSKLVSSQLVFSCVQQVFILRNPCKWLVF